MPEGPIATTAASVRFLQHLTSLTYFFGETFQWIFVGILRGRRIRVREVVIQMDQVGFKSMPIVFLIAFFIGVILALQTAYQLRTIGATNLVGALVGVAVTRELAPILTAVVISGRVGAAFAAELGTMKVSEEILALEVMALNPIWFLVVPRTLALLIMLPVLTIFADLLGMIGGLLIGVTILEIPFRLYVDTTIEALAVQDIVTGLIKSAVFALIVVTIGCYRAFIVEGGAEGVGKATMKSVVASLVLIIFADAIFTLIFYFLL